MVSRAATTGVRPRVHEVRNLTDSTYVLRFDRNGMEFQPGQYVAVGVAGDINMREYSIYSAPQDDFLEILVREVEEGLVSRRLRRLEPGAELTVDGPFGFFVIDDDIVEHGRLLFVATGTGISPFHCFVRAYSGLNYRLLHGVRTLDERYEHAVFDGARVTTCASREPVGRASGSIPVTHADRSAARSDTSGAPEQLFPGRVTAYLRENPVDPDTRCYLCGNCDMIYEAFDILKGHGVPPEQLFAEVYF